MEWVAGLVGGFGLGVAINELVLYGRRKGAEAGTECGRKHKGGCVVEHKWVGWRCVR